jgi:putative salt-induced outer membrane protein YdiY
MNSYRKPRVRAIGLTSVLLKGGKLGIKFDFGPGYRIL